MKRFCASMVVISFVWASGAIALAQGTPPAQTQAAPTSAPTLVRVDGQLRTPTGEPRTGSAVVVVSLYAEKDDATPLWVEQQLVSLDAAGRYTVFAGATLPDGVPTEFLTGATAGRWLGVGAQGEAEQFRMMLVTVPYALKAREADTLGGKSLSDFVLTESLSDTAKASLKASGAGLAGTSAGGPGTLISTAGKIPKFSDVSNNTVDSVMSEAGGNIAVGTGAPGAKLQVNSLTNDGVKITDGTTTGILFTSSVLGNSLVYGTQSNHPLLFGTNNSFDRITVLANGRIGINTSTPSAKFDIIGSGTANTAGDALGQDAIVQGANAALGAGGNPANLNIESNSAVAIDAGGTIGFGGRYLGTQYAQFGVIKGGKEDGTGGNFGGYLAFGTRLNGGNITERVRISPTGGFGIGTTLPTARLQVTTPINDGIKITDGTTTALIFASGLLTNSLVLGTQSNHPIVFGTNNAFDRLTILANGNVGIGTTNPTSKFHVLGDVTVSGNIAAKYQDVAEWVETDAPLSAGTVVIVDPLQPNRVIPATRAYDTRVAGAVSRQPGLVLGEASDTKSLIAQSGRVRIKADAKYGAIKPGDLLVTSPTPGYAMRSRTVKAGAESFHRPGTLLGKALEALPNGKGEILVLLTLQ